MSEQSGEESVRVFIDQLEAGKRVKISVLVLEKRTQMARTGTPYISLLVGDKSGSIQGRVWERAQKLSELFEEGDFVLIDGQVETYKTQIQLRIVDLEKLAEEQVDIRDFQPASRYEPDQMLAELRQLVIAEVNKKVVRKLLLSILADERLIDGLSRVPAAKVHHHAYLGGLLEHTLSMARIAVSIAHHYREVYPQLLDGDLLVAGAILHDIGKIWEYTSDRRFEFTDEGRLIGHAALAVELITQTMRRQGIEERELELRLKHMVLSHHGELEYGAAVLPQTPEAQVLHYIDQIDARLNMFATAIDASVGNWTPWVRSLGRFAYVGSRESDGDGSKPASGEDESRAKAKGDTLDLFGERKQ